MKKKKKRRKKNKKIKKTKQTKKKFVKNGNDSKNQNLLYWDKNSN